MKLIHQIFLIDTLYVSMKLSRPRDAQKIDVKSALRAPLKALRPPHRGAGGGDRYATDCGHWRSNFFSNNHSTNFNQYVHQ